MKLFDHEDSDPEGVDYLRLMSDTLEETTYETAMRAKKDVRLRRWDEAI